MKKKLNSNIIELLTSFVLSCLIIIFILIPFLLVFKESFFKNGIFTLDNFKSILSDKRILLNTFRLGTLTTLVATFSSICVSLFYFFQNKNIKKIIFLILSITLISPPFVSSLSYISLFGRRGLITYSLLNLNINPYGMWGIVFMQSLSDLSLNCLILIGFLENLDTSIINSARSLGAKINYIIKDIILPYLKTGILSVMILSFFRSISDFGTPAIIGGNYSVLALESYFEVIANGNLNLASAMNVIILLPTLLIFLFYRNKLNSLNTSYVVRNQETIPIKRNGILYYLVSFFAIFFIIWICLLYASIILTAFTRMNKGNLVFTTNNFIEARPYIGGSVIRSIVYSLISALAGTFIGLMIGYLLVIKKKSSMKIIDAIANLPYIIPGTFFGLGYLLFFRNPPIAITGTSAIVVLNVLFKQLPFSSRVGSAAMEDIDRSILNSIRDLGGSSFNEIKDGIIPLAKNSILISMINAFTTTMTTIGSIIFLVYPSQKVMTLVMFDLIQSGKYNIGSVIAILIILICLAFNFIIRFFFRRSYVS